MPRTVVRSIPFFLAALALSSCSAAVPAGPTRHDAMAALARGDDNLARQQFDAVARANIDTMEGAIALDALAVLNGTQPFPERGYNCSPASAEAADRAETFFQTSRLEESEAAFAEALRGCPDNARWWIHAGDVDFRRRRLEAAREKYRRGLALDPWNRSGHRFLSDAEIGLGNREAAWDHLVLAVLSDPTYEAGWEYLKQATLAQGGTFHRQYEFKTAAWMDGETLRVRLDSMAARPFPKEWVLYFEPGPARSDAAARVASGGMTDPPQEPLARKRRILVSLLDEEYDPDNVRPSTRPSKMWPAFAQARKEGFLDEAIFLHLLDASLVPEYVAYREKSRARLVEYVERFLAVRPRGVGDGPKSNTASSVRNAKVLLASR
jgi:tetratricopeptide (TPR) repeat protein